MPDLSSKNSKFVFYKVVLMVVVPTIVNTSFFYTVMEAISGCSCRTLRGNFFATWL